MNASVIPQASWCTPCRAESPALVAAYNKYKNKGFEILSISFDQKKEPWLKAVAKEATPGAILLRLPSCDPKALPPAG